MCRPVQMRSPPRRTAAFPRRGSWNKTSRRGGTRQSSSQSESRHSRLNAVDAAHQCDSVIVNSMIELCRDGCDRSTRNCHDTDLQPGKWKPFELVVCRTAAAACLNTWHQVTPGPMPWQTVDAALTPRSWSDNGRPGTEGRLEAARCVVTRGIATWRWRRVAHHIPRPFRENPRPARQTR